MIPASILAKSILLDHLVGADGLVHEQSRLDKIIPAGRRRGALRQEMQQVPARNPRRKIDGCTGMQVVIPELVRQQPLLRRGARALQAVPLATHS